MYDMLRATPDSRAIELGSQTNYLLRFMIPLWKFQSIFNYNLCDIFDHSLMNEVSLEKKTVSRTVQYAK